MTFPSRFVLGLVAWLGLEFAAFVAVADTIGFAGALLLGMATSLAGFVLLRETGQGAMQHLLAALSGGRRQQGNMVDGLIRALAALLLIIPGFISDLAGLALAAPSIRQVLARRFGSESFPSASRRRENPGIIDLTPEEWVSCDRPAKPVRH
jgi:UPF0716 protein FxsA